MLTLTEEYSNRFRNVSWVITEYKAWVIKLSLNPKVQTFLTLLITCFLFYVCKKTWIGFTWNKKQEIPEIMYKRENANILRVRFIPGAVNMSCLFHLV